MNMPPQYRLLEGSERQIAPRARLIGPADPNETLPVSIYVRPHADAPALPDHDHWMATPPAQRSFLSRADLAQQLSATQADLDQVAAFARAHGLAVEEVDPARRLIVVSGTVQQMNQAFAVELRNYEIPSGTYRGREGALYLPTELIGVVEGVFGLDNRPLHRLQSSSTSASMLTPVQVANLYHFPQINAGGQTIGILEFGGGWVVNPTTGRPTDIDLFFQILGLPSPNLTAVSVDHAQNIPAGSLTHPILHNPDAEIVLDIDVAGSIAAGANIVVYLAPNSEQGYVDALSTILADTTNSPSVLSISWGGPEGISYSRSGMNKLSQCFQAAAAVGITVFVSSGDNGTDCGVGDGKARVEYPASDPWVTSCGGTLITNATPTSFTENSWNDASGATGGGVSSYFAPPPWQAGATIPPSINGSTTAGRGVPDIAGNASPSSGYVLPLYGLPGSSGGTSAVAPLYAGLIAQINAALHAPVGFLNPTLYALAAGNNGVFNDVNDGSTNAYAGAPGYVCGPGWDACTGWGSVNGSALAYALGVPREGVNQMRLQILGIHDPVPGTPEQVALVHSSAKVRVSEPPNPIAKTFSIPLVQDGTFEGYERDYPAALSLIDIQIEVWRTVDHKVEKHGKVETINGQRYIVFSPQEKYPVPPNWDQLPPNEQAALETIILEPPVPPGFVHRFTLHYDLKNRRISGDAVGIAGETIHTENPRQINETRLQDLSLPVVTFVITQN